MSIIPTPHETKAAAVASTAEARLEALEESIVEIYTKWIDPDKGEGGTLISIETMLQQIEEVLEHNLAPGRYDDFDGGE